MKTNRLKKTQEKVIKYFDNLAFYVNTKKASKDLGISRETLTMNLRILDEMNVLERRFKMNEVLVLVNSRQDWQVYQKNDMPKNWS